MVVATLIAAIYGPLEIDAQPVFESLASLKMVAIGKTGF